MRLPWVRNRNRGRKSSNDIARTATCPECEDGPSDSGRGIHQTSPATAKKEQSKLCKNGHPGNATMHVSAEPNPRDSKRMSTHSSNATGGILKRIFHRIQKRKAPRSAKVDGKSNTKQYQTGPPDPRTSMKRPSYPSDTRTNDTEAPSNVFLLGLSNIMVNADLPPCTSTSPPNTSDDPRDSPTITVGDSKPLANYIPESISTPDLVFPKPSDRPRDSVMSTAEESMSAASSAESSLMAEFVPRDHMPLGFRTSQESMPNMISNATPSGLDTSTLSVDTNSLRLDTKGDSTTMLNSENGSLLKADYQFPVWVSHGEPPTDPVAIQAKLITWVKEKVGPTKYDGMWYPVWKREPSIRAMEEAIRPHVHLCGLDANNITIKVFSSGAYNKVFLVSSKDTSNRTECILRVCPPIYPWYKVQSEVATMEYVRLRTTIPVPKIYAFDTTTTNPIGFEWILMERVRGMPYHRLESDLSYNAKANMVRTVADWCTQLSDLRFSQIGSLYCDWHKPTANPLDKFYVGPMVIHAFMPDLRTSYSICRGPYNSISSYFTSLVTLHLNEASCPEQHARLADNKVISWRRNSLYECISELHGVAELCRDLYALIPQMLPQGTAGDAGDTLGPDTTRLSHFDISVANVLVDMQGVPISLIDWEMATVEPSVFVSPRPRIIECRDAPEPPLTPTDGRKKPKWSADDEDRWVLMKLRDLFDDCINEGGSRHLETFHERGNVWRDDMYKLHAVVTEMWENHGDPEWDWMQEMIKRYGLSWKVTPPPEITRNGDEEGVESRTADGSPMEDGDEMQGGESL